MSRIVQRSQRCEFFDLRHNISVYFNGLIEVGAALNDPVAGCGNFIQTFNDVIFDQGFQKQLNRNLVILDRQILLYGGYGLLGIAFVLAVFNLA